MFYVWDVQPYGYPITLMIPKTCTTFGFAHGVLLQGGMQDMTKIPKESLDWELNDNYGTSGYYSGNSGTIADLSGQAGWIKEVMFTAC